MLVCFRLFKVFLIVFLIVFTMPVNVVFANESTPNDVIGDTLDIPYETALDNALDNVTNSTVDTDPLTAYILKRNPGISTGEMYAVGKMINSQMNENDLHFIMCYINDSDEWVDPGLQLTAHELVNQSGYYATKWRSFDRIVEDYGHMTRNEKVEFLKTEDPGTESLISFFTQMSESNDVIRLAYVLNGSKDAFDDYKNKVDKIDGGHALKAGGIIDEADKDLSNRLMSLSVSFDMDVDDNLTNVSDWYDITDDKWNWQHLQRDKIEESYLQLTTARDSIEAVQDGLIAAQVILDTIILAVATLIHTIIISIIAAAASFAGMVAVPGLAALNAVLGIILGVLSAVLGYVNSLLFNFMNGPIGEAKSKIDLLCNAMKMYLDGPSLD